MACNLRSIEAIRADFPFFSANPDWAYLDNSATSQTPRCVAERLNRFLLYEKASPLRGLYDLSIRATEDYEAARAAAASFIHAENASEIIFTRNASERLNLAAFILSSLLSPGDEIIVSIAEHHSNLVPWQEAAARTGAVVKYMECNPEGVFDVSALERLLTERTRILALTHMSNVFGRENDLQSFTEKAHESGVLVVADGCQSVPHIPVNVQTLGVDFLAFSGHKMLAPTGIGILYGRKALLESLPPYMTGGEMIEYVTTEHTTFAAPPQKYEAGTVNTGDALAFAEAIRYMEHLGFPFMMAREAELTEYLLQGMNSIPHVRIVGGTDPSAHHGIVTFLVDGVHPHDIASIMSDNHIAVRAGHHCAQPLHQHLGIPASTRVSLMFYNTREEISRFLNVLSDVREVMGYGR